MSAASRSTKGSSQRSRTAGTSGHGSRTASKAGVGGAGKPAKDSGDVLKAREKEYRYSAVSSCPRLLGRLLVEVHVLSEGVSGRWGCPNTQQIYRCTSFSGPFCLPIKALLCIASYEHRQKHFQGRKALEVRPIYCAFDNPYRLDTPSLTYLVSAPDLDPPCTRKKNGTHFPSVFL